MKQLTIDLNNKEKLILVEVPMDAHSFSISHKQQGLGWREEEMNESVLNYKTIDLKYGEKNALIFLGDKANYLLYNPKFSILGTYLPRTGEIDFADKIQDDWVERSSLVKANNGYGGYMDYCKQNTNLQCRMDTAAESFISLLKTETEKAFPIADKLEWKPRSIGSTTMVKDEIESKVMPHKFIVLKSL